MRQIYGHGLVTMSRPRPTLSILIKSVSLRYLTVVLLIQNWSFICALIGVALEVLTLMSFLLIFVRLKSKKEVRKSERYSSFVQSATAEQGTFDAFVPRDEEPSTPSRAYAQLEGTPDGYRKKEQDLWVK